MPNYCACHTKRLSTRLQTRENVGSALPDSQNDISVQPALTPSKRIGFAWFCSFPHRHGGARGKPGLGTRHVALRARLPPIFTLCSFKIAVSCDFSYELQNLLPQNQCFVRGFRQFSVHLAKCRACHGICTLSPFDAALTKRFAKNEPQDTSKVRKVLRLPRKMTIIISKLSRSPGKCDASSENVAKVLRLPHKTIFDTVRHTFECHEVPRLPRETKLRDAGNLQK